MKNLLRNYQFKKDHSKKKRDRLVTVTIVWCNEIRLSLSFGKKIRASQLSLCEQM